MRSIVLIAHNLRSCHNVGSLLRTAEGLAASTVYLTGYTPYPIKENDQRLPHEAQKIEKQIQKTALDAQNLVKWEHHENVLEVIQNLQASGYDVAAVEQAHGAVELPKWNPGAKVALLVGREVEGVEPEILAACKTIVEIPMLGQKESFNVVQAAAMVLYHCRFN